MRSDHERHLTSTWLNIVAAGTVSGGLISQLTALAAGASAIPAIVIALGCIGSGLALHGAALLSARPPDRRPIPGAPDDPGARTGS